MCMPESFNGHSEAVFTSMMLIFMDLKILRLFQRLEDCNILLVLKTSKLYAYQISLNKRMDKLIQDVFSEDLKKSNIIKASQTQFYWK